MVLEIEVQGARQVRAAMPEAILIFIAPPSPAALRERLEGRATDSAEAIERRLRTAEIELEAQVEFPHVVVNDDVQKAAAELEAARPGASSPYTDAHVNDPATSRQASRADRLPLRRRRGRGEARPPDQRLLPLPLRGRLRRVHAADGRGPAAATTSRSRSRRPPPASSSTSTRPSAGPSKEGRWPASCSGVTGGIAAYKALELARLATREGHAVRVLMTPAAQALRRRRVLRGDRRRPGAQRRVRARPGARRLPRRSGARARPDRPPGGRGERRRLPGRPGLGEHRREARGRDRRLDGHHLLPRLLRAAPRRARR